MYDPMESFNAQRRQMEEQTNKALEAVRRKREEQESREIENNQNIKQIVMYNKMLTEKMSLTTDVLESILNSIGANSQRIEQQEIEHNKYLLELTALLQESLLSKDESKLKEFFKRIPSETAMVLIPEAIKSLVGL